MAEPLEERSTAVLFTQARTPSAWKREPVSDDVLLRIYELARLGPTSANCSPARFVFVRSPEGREQLRPALSKGNVDQTLTAPVTVIVAHDSAFYDQLSRLFPHADARSWFAASPSLVAETALRNGSLQAAYLILAARSQGIDAGPMSGFDRNAVDRAFFEGSTWRADLLVNLGHADRSKLRPRLPRLSFEEACRYA